MVCESAVARVQYFVVLKIIIINFFSSAITGPVDIGEAITTVLPVETTVTDCELDVYLTTDEQLLDGSNSSIDDTVYDSTYIDFKG